MAALKKISSGLVKAPNLAPKPQATTPGFASWADPNGAWAKAAKNLAAPKAAAPAAPAPYTGTPVDPTYDSTVAALARQRDDTDASLDQQKQAGLLDYGYTPTYDASGNVSALNFDPNNPFSKAALLQKNWQQAKTGNTNSLAARGQLYSGALINAQNNADDQKNQGDDTLKKSLAAFLASNAAAKKTADTGYETGVGSASGDAVNRAIAWAEAHPPPTPTVAPVSVDGTGGPPTFASSTAQKSTVVKRKKAKR